LLRKGARCRQAAALPAHSSTSSTVTSPARPSHQHRQTDRQIGLPCPLSAPLPAHLTRTDRQIDRHSGLSCPLSAPLPAHITRTGAIRKDEAAVQAASTCRRRSRSRVGHCRGVLVRHRRPHLCVYPSVICCASMRSSGLLIHLLSYLSVISHPCTRTFNPSAHWRAVHLARMDR
jgi:hypothetical protein